MEFCENSKPFGSNVWLLETDLPRKNQNVVGRFSKFVPILMESFLSIEDPLFLERGGRPTLPCNHYINTSLVLKKEGEKLFVNFALVY